MLYCEIQILILILIPVAPLLNLNYMNYIFDLQNGCSGSPALQRSIVKRKRLLSFGGVGQTTHREECDEVGEEKASDARYRMKNFRRRWALPGTLNSQKLIKL